MNIIDMGPMWRQSSSRANGGSEQFPASEPGAQKGLIHTAEVEEVCIEIKNGSVETLEVKVANGKYHGRLYYNLDYKLIPPSMENQDEAKKASAQMRNFDKLKKITSILGLAVPVGIDLSESRLNSAKGRFLKISVKDSGKFREDKNGMRYPKLFIDAIGYATELLPILSNETVVDSGLNNDSWADLDI